MGSGILARVLGVVVVFGILEASPATAQVGLARKVLLQQDLAIPGYETILAEVTIAVGGREGRHSHDGTLIAHILEGVLTLELEGQPTKIIKAGESALIEPRQIHEGFNKGSVPIKAIVTFVVEKGKPLSTPAP